MAPIPPPQGMNEVDYEAIEAAVTETVRGRWFLAEFARRNRLAETRQLLDAMARLEAAVAAGPPALPSADPSVRLLIQRIKEIAGQLGMVAGDMRASGVEARFVEAVDGQARAVSGMMRSATPTSPALAGPAQGAEPARLPDPAKTPEMPKPAPPAAPRMPRADLPPGLAAAPAPGGEQRFGALSAFDALPLADKLAVFR